MQWAICIITVMYKRLNKLIKLESKSRMTMCPIRSSQCNIFLLNKKEFQNEK